MANVLQALNVRVVGIGSKYMVLAHGFGTDQSSWRQVLPYLTHDYRVVLFDLAFSGSVNPDYFDFSRYTTLDAYVDDLFLILDSLGITSCCYIGHSISAMIGVVASIRRPSLFFKLILMGASPRYLNEDEKYEGGFKKEVLQSMFTAMESSYQGWVNEFAPLVIEADVPDAVTEFSRTLLNMRPDISLFVCRWMFECDFRSILHMVKTRCLIIHTFKDFSVPISIAVYLIANLGGRTNIIMINTEGHIPHISAPTLTGEALIRALTAP